MNTHNEDDDTYRFLKDCEKWYDTPISEITAIGEKYKSIQDIWRKHKALNNASGAICSSVLKRDLRLAWQKQNEYDYQVFGFEFDKSEFNRALSMKTNHPVAKPIFPLLMMGYSKDDCAGIINDAGIAIPMPYTSGFRNNNCFKTGCVQGGVGYWQKMKVDRSEVFNTMAALEHELTNAKGSPVTMLRDQSKTAKGTENAPVFLKKHPSYPNLKTIDDMKGRPVEPLKECNGFCSTNDLSPLSQTWNELNIQEDEIPN